MMRNVKGMLARLNPLKALRVREPLPFWKAALLSVAMVFIVLLLWVAVTSAERLGIIARRRVKDFSDLRGKTVMLVKDSPAHEFLMEELERDAKRVKEELGRVEEELERHTKELGRLKKEPQCLKEELERVEKELGRLNKEHGRLKEELESVRFKPGEVALKFVSDEESAITAFLSDPRIDACALSTEPMLEKALDYPKKVDAGSELEPRLLTWFEPRMISPQILPGPGEVLSAFPKMHRDMELMLGLVYSLRRVTLGFIIAAIIAIPLGIAMGAFTRVRGLLNPVAIIGGYIPVAALVPLTMATWADEKQKVMFLAIATFVGLLPLVIRAIDRVDDIYLQTAYTLGATRWQTVRRVLVPVAMLEVYQSLRLVYGVGWGYIILAEVVDAKCGIGFIIAMGQRRGTIEVVYASLLVIVVVAVLIDVCFKKLGNILFPYARA